MEQSKSRSVKGQASGQSSGPAESEGANGKQVIARAAAVLRALEGQMGGLSLAQIARASDLPRTTVHRIVNALEAQQMVTAGIDGVRLGPAIARLAASAHTDLVALARPSVEALGRRTLETVDVCMFRGQHAISVDQYASNQELRVVSPVGTAFATYCTAHGKALLAHHSDDEIRSLFPAGLQKRTDSTIDSMARLLADMTTIREAGFATDMEEHAEGVCGVGVRLRTGLPDDYAIALAVPTNRFKQKRDSLLAALMQCKSEIEALMGAPAGR